MKKTNTEVDPHERKATYHINGYCVATLYVASDNIEFHNEITEKEKEEAYISMRKEVNNFMQEFNLN